MFPRTDPVIGIRIQQLGLKQKMSVVQPCSDCLVYKIQAPQTVVQIFHCEQLYRVASIQHHVLSYILHKKKDNSAH